MFDYISLRIDTTPNNDTINDLLAAFLADLDFETFVPDDTGITAFVRKDKFDEAAVNDMIQNFPIPAEIRLKPSVVKGEDWNREWEQHYYEPILIDDKCVIRSSFHTDVPKAPVEIIIDPKMAFGTGHHSTTAAMVRLILRQDIKGKKVIDMGTGTGILAILCKMLGAEEVVAVEIDPFALENAVENGNVNRVEVSWICGDATKLSSAKNGDLFLANINRNVILSDMAKYVECIRRGGHLILSGFYSVDLPMIEKTASGLSLLKSSQIIDNDWVGVVFEKI